MQIASSEFAYVSDGACSQACRIYSFTPIQNAMLSSWCAQGMPDETPSFKLFSGKKYIMDCKDGNDCHILHRCSELLCAFSPLYPCSET